MYKSRRISCANSRFNNLYAMENCRYRVNFDVRKNNKVYQRSWKENLKISKIAKFGFEMWQNTKNIALSYIGLYIFVLWLDKAITPEQKMSGKPTKMQKKLIH